MATGRNAYFPHGDLLRVAIEQVSHLPQMRRLNIDGEFLGDSAVH
jgi:hypothetical protein